MPATKDVAAPRVQGFISRGSANFRLLLPPEHSHRTPDGYVTFRAIPTGTQEASTEGKFLTDDPVLADYLRGRMDMISVTDVSEDESTLQLRCSYGQCLYMAPNTPDGRKRLMAHMRTEHDA